ncbi:hypothetical protein SMAG_02441 [Staphylococcus aureus A8819]|nr:hypothetical protein SKAG_01519 [Staphylococcus aureus A9754]EFG43873.1 hypothetical protein SMAG_02441 [Staphylococcus aureus A8819]BAB95695.1 hypothetical protein [Staphylococcus aureus subsp. aureus MW2]CAG43617.1 hypothetical protein SAS1811a [Staphylococcus aureus subsp. aureus MSSA476]
MSLNIYACNFKKGHAIYDKKRRGHKSMFYALRSYIGSS